MRSFAQHPAQFLRRLIARLRGWRNKDQVALPLVSSFSLLMPPSGPSIHRDVSANGVRYFSVCGDCGSRLNASATLCEDCAQKRSRPARPY